MQNLELKAQYHDLDKAISISEELRAVFTWTQKQTDTYFKVSHGKLKLREQEGGTSELIGYTRPDVSGERVSDYLLYSTDNPEALKEILTSTLGQLTSVVKRRTLYLWKNVRIHLDKVEHLGNFVEFEAVMDAENSKDVSQERIEYLKKMFEINKDDLMATGYFELLSQTRE